MGYAQAPATQPGIGLTLWRHKLFQTSPYILWTNALALRWPPRGPKALRRWLGRGGWRTEMSPVSGAWSRQPRMEGEDTGFAAQLPPVWSSASESCGADGPRSVPHQHGHPSIGCGMRKRGHGMLGKQISKVEQIPSRQGLWSLRIKVFCPFSSGDMYLSNEKGALAQSVLPRVPSGHWQVKWWELLLLVEQRSVLNPFPLEGGGKQGGGRGKEEAGLSAA